MSEWWHGKVGQAEIFRIEISGPAKEESFYRLELMKWIEQWPGWDKEFRARLRDNSPSSQEEAIDELNRLRARLAEKDVELRRMSTRLSAASGREARERLRKGRAMWAEDLGRWQPPTQVVYEADWTGAENWLETMKYCEEGP